MPGMHFKKKPELILVIDNYKHTNPNLIENLCKKYSLNKCFVMSSKESAFTWEDSIDVSKRIGYPDLIILCSDILQFKIKDPNLLYKAEIWHKRQSFTEEVLMGGLMHYSECEIRNGK